MAVFRIAGIGTEHKNDDLSHHIPSGDEEWGKEKAVRFLDLNSISINFGCCDFELERAHHFTCFNNTNR